MTTIPVDYAQMSCIFSLTGIRKRPTITLAVYAPPGATAATINTAWRNSLTGTGCLFSAASMYAPWIIDETRVLLNRSGILHSDVNLTNVVGTATGTKCPSPNVAVVLAKNTALAGRQYRGRMFAPPCNIDELDVGQDGVIQSSALSALNTSCALIRSTLEAAGFGPVIFHAPPLSGPTPTPTDITSITVTPLVGSTRRRIR
jgi:hypothetical protein